MTRGAKDAGRLFRMPVRYRAGRWIRRTAPLVVWLGATALVVTLYLGRDTAADLTGFADETRYSVDADMTGRIERLEVGLNDYVERDQIVAVLDDREILLNLNRARAELNRLEAELERERALLRSRSAEEKTDFDAERRRFARDIEQAHIDYLRRLADLEEDKVRLQGLNLRLERSAGLETEALASRAQLDEDKTARDALKKRIDEQTPLIADLEKRYKAAQKRFDDYIRSHPREESDGELLVKPLRYAVRVQQVRLEQINLEVTRLVLRAPANGRVSRIMRRAGEVVTVGEPVVQVIEPRAAKIVAWLPEERMLAVRPGTRVELVRRADPRRRLSSVVQEIGARVMRLPDRLAPVAGAPQWGVPVHIPLPDQLQASPGEAFDVRFVAGSED